MRRSRLCADVFGVLEGSRLRQLTMQIAPSFGFGACDRRVRARIRFSRRHRQMILKDGAVTRRCLAKLDYRLYLADEQHRRRPDQADGLTLQIVHSRAETASRVRADSLFPECSPQMKTARRLEPTRRMPSLIVSRISAR